LSGTKIDGKKIRSFAADGLTVNGYLGSDGIMPFVKSCEKDGSIIFVLVKTSNKSSGEYQDRDMCGDSAYVRMAEMVSLWGESTVGKYGYSSVGAVVGATYPSQLVELREKFSNMFFLVPGYGAQGAGAKDIAGAFDKNGLGALVNSSRAIMCAWQKTGKNGTDLAEAAYAEAIHMRDDIQANINKLVK